MTVLLFTSNDAIGEIVIMGIRIVIHGTKANHGNHGSTLVMEE
ncbi:MAG: hypothetical protein VYD77_02700 [Actinomycetota bacterium]|nr:hypothetical protein [Actinomycetota bacterium]